MHPITVDDPPVNALPHPGEHLLINKMTGSVARPRRPVRRCSPVSRSDGVASSWSNIASCQWNCLSTRSSARHFCQRRCAAHLIRLDERTRRFYDREERRLPVGHVGGADDIAAAYIYFMKNTYATGNVLSVDGGGSLV